MHPWFQRTNFNFFKKEFQKRTDALEPDFGEADHLEVYESSFFEEIYQMRMNGVGDAKPVGEILSEACHYFPLFGINRIDELKADARCKVVKISFWLPCRRRVHLGQTAFPGL